MNHPHLAIALLGALALSACEKPVVVNMPTPPAAAPGPAGPAGATGVQGADGVKGDTGKTGDAATVIVVPVQASAPTL